MSFRRFRILALIAVSSVLIPSPVFADDCDRDCELTTWYLASELTKSRQWFGGVYAGLPVAQCIRHRESRDDYRAENAHSSASGAYQFLIGTSNNVAAAMGRHDLVGFPAGTWAPWDQHLAFGWLYEREGLAPWGGACR